MSRTLIICDNEFISTLYVMNLEVYLATSIELCLSVEDGVAAHKKQKNFDLIICLETINRKNAFKEIQEYRGAYGVKTPLIVIGGEKDADIDAKTFIINSRYNLPAILKKAAFVLKVTAKQMAEMEMGAYYPISMSTAESIAKSPCTIYTQNESGQFKIFARTDDNITEKLVSVRSNGVDKVFVRSSDRLVLINNASIRLIERITSALNSSEGETIEKKVEILNDGYDFAAANLFSSEEIKREMQEIASASARVMSDVIKEKSQLKGLLDIMMSNKSGYIFTHSMINSYVAQHIIRNVSWGGKGQSEKINFVLFFHDIYLAPIYLKHPKLQFEKNLLDSPDLSDKEKEIVMDHAKLAAELVVVYKKCPMGADILIKHHHGMSKGSGFANKYPEDLSPITKVLLIAEAFTEEFIALSNGGKTVDPKIIMPKLINEFVSASYIKIIQTLVNIQL